MLISTIILFAIAAVLGLLLIAKVFKEEVTPKPIVILHGIAAAPALIILLILYIWQGESNLMTSALAFSIAALGGAVLLAQDLSGNQISKSVAIIHAMVAVIGFILLLIVVI
jgi:hypothetical protein